jgi:hypothetical protein
MSTGATAGTGQSATAGRGGSSAAGSTAGASATSGTGGSSAAGAGASGMSTGGMMAAAGSGGADAAPATGCTRDLLKSTIDMYFTALAAHDPKTLPLADNVKFTENGMMQPIGTAGLWKTAGMVKYKHSALDVESCNSVSESVVPDGSMDIPLGLRIKLASGKITEVETIAVRPGDYKVFGSSFPSNTGAISASKDRVKWEEVIPADQRNTRKEITDWLDRYFRTFPRGGCNFADNCQRLENGGGSFECSAALSCEMGMVSMTGGTLKPRLILVDEELGIGVGFTLFMNNTDFHMIKMYGGKIYAVHAILGAAMSSGWD